MNDACKDAGLPEPSMQEIDGGFRVTVIKERYSKAELERLGFNERQMKAIWHVRDHGTITSGGYQKINGIAKTSSVEELQDIVEKKVLIKVGKGRATKYEIIVY